MNIIDLSLTIDNTCMTCGTPWHSKVDIKPLGTLAVVGRNTSKFVLGSHTATHMDAPLHFISGAHGIDTVNLGVCTGEVTCVDFRDIAAGEQVTLQRVQKINITERMLFVFGWSKNWKKDTYYLNFPFFTSEAVSYMLDKGMKFIAMDTPSPDTGSAINEKDDSPNHKLMLEKDVVIVEYLTNTESIDFSKRYEIFALPLKIADADGSPARVILREVIV